MPSFGGAESLENLLLLSLMLETAMPLVLPRLRLLGYVDEPSQGNYLSVYLVDGERIRNTIDIDFINGGNGAVYPTYIPPDEIWIDDAQHALDRTATALHELIERDRMFHHGWGYDRAHDFANMYERPFRCMLMKRRPKVYDGKAVSSAYNAYLSGKKRLKKSSERRI